MVVYKIQSKMRVLVGCGTLLCCAFVLCGCSGNYVIVKDDKGNPVQGAEVYATALSIGAGPNLTNENGFAHVPSCVQQTQWISIRKDGYEYVRFEVQRKNRIEVVLRTDR